MKTQTDIFGKTLQIGDTIIFNPPKYKGVMHAKCIGFTKAGLPIVDTTFPCAANILFNGIPAASLKTSFAIK